jgi:hypothetical protein
MRLLNRLRGNSLDRRLRDTWRCVWHELYELPYTVGVWGRRVPSLSVIGSKTQAATVI